MRTQADNTASEQFPLNLTTSGDYVNITTEINNATDLAPAPKPGNKKSRKYDEPEAEAEANCENNLCIFPMNRVCQIIKGDNPDIKLSQEALFVVTRASEKFLQVFCREAYACSFIDDKKETAYNHLSSVVSRRKRLNFLSDFIPTMVKAEEALAHISDAEK